MKTMSRMFLNGLFAILPISITAYAVYWLATKAERLLGEPLRSRLGTYPNGYYFYGLGMAIGVVAVVCLGTLLEFYVGRLLLRWSERLMGSIPMVKTIYGSIRDLLNFISSNKMSDAKMVVMEIVPGTRILGYVTRDVWTGLKADIAQPGEVAVFLPFSYALGGYTVMTQRSRLTPVNLNFEEGYRFALTAYMISPTAGKSHSASHRTMKDPHPAGETKSE